MVICGPLFLIYKVRIGTLTSKTVDAKQDTEHLAKSLEKLNIK